MKKIIDFLKRLFSKAKFLTEKYVVPAVHVVEGFKKVVDSPTTDILSALIPGTVDDLIILKLRKALPKALTALKLVEKAGNETSLEGLVRIAAEQVRDLPQDQKSIVLHNIAVMLASYLSDNRLSISEAIMLSEYIYTTAIKGKK